MIRLNKMKNTKRILLISVIIILLISSIPPKMVYAINNKDEIADYLMDHYYENLLNRKNAERIVNILDSHELEARLEGGKLVLIYPENANPSTLKGQLSDELSTQNLFIGGLFDDDNTTYEKKTTQSTGNNGNSGNSGENNNNEKKGTKEQIYDKLDKYSLTKAAKDIVYDWYVTGERGATSDKAVTVKMDAEGNVIDVTLDIDKDKANAIGMSDGTYSDVVEDNNNAEKDSKLEGADKGAAGGVLFEPIAWLLQGIGDVSNQMIQRVLMGSWERVFFDTGFGNFNETKVKEVIGRNPTMGELENVDVVQDYIKGWTKHYGVPEIRITPAEIFAGNVAALDANFFEDDANVSNKLGGDEFSTVLQLKPVVAKWYVAIRNIAIVGLLSVLLYIGIRIIVSSSAGDKAKYKQLFTDWVVALCLIFFMHYIMSFTMTMSETVTDVLSGSNTQQGTIKQVNIRLTDTNGSPIGGLAFSSNFTGVARIKADYKDTALKMGYSILYLILTGYTVYFSFVYLKRLVMLAFFTMIAPLVALTYPIDKVKDGKAQAFNYWFKEYMFYALLQPMHMVLYTVLIGSALNIATTNLLYAIVAFACIVPAEKIVKQMFGIKGQTESAISGFAGGALASQAVNAIKSLGKGKVGPPKPAGNAANNGIRMPSNSGGNAMNALAGDAMNLDSSTVNSASAAMAGAAAGAGMASGNSAADAYQNSSDPVADSERENLEEQLADGTINPNELTDEQRAILGMNEPNEKDASSSSSSNMQPEPQNTIEMDPSQERYEALKRQIKGVPSNFYNAAKRRWVAAGGAKGVLKKGAKGYAKFAGAVTGAALGASMGAIGGDVNNLWQAGVAGLGAGSFVANKASNAVANIGNTSAARFAKEVWNGDNYQKREFINQYMKDPSNRQRILEKNPNMSTKEVKAQMMAEANMMADTGVSDYTTTKRAVKMEKAMIEEQEAKLDKSLSKEERDKRMERIRQNAHEMTASYAQLSQSYDKSTFTDPKKKEAAQKALQNKLEKQLSANGIKNASARAQVEAERTMDSIETLKNPFYD